MKKIIIALSLSLAIFGCSNDDDKVNGNQDAAVLAFPENNTECITGINISPSQSKVTFEWGASPDTDKYFVYVKNLNTQLELQYNAGNATSFEIPLSKGTPYSWFVASRKNTGNVINSEKWKFYNAGEPVSSHAPFPADLVGPAMSSTLNNTSSANLQWNGSDIDNDIKQYDVYAGNTTNPATMIGTVTQENISMPVSAGNTYYWKVVTHDNAGNSTPSPVCQFKVD